MSDRTEDEEERYLRRVSRRMKVHPEGLLNRLRPLGFILLSADRNLGMNEIEYLRSTPGLLGLFDHLKLKADIGGNRLAVYVSQAIVSHHTPCTKVDSYVPATSYGYEKEYAPTRTVTECIEFEARLAQAVPELFAALHQRAGQAFYEATAAARTAADFYLRALNPSTDIVETLRRLRATATEDQWQQALEYVRRELTHPLNLVDFRPIWETAGLCQVLYWERPGQYRGLGGGVFYKQASADDREAHCRLHLVASRLARAPGWPIADPLVPNRCDLEETIAWRDHKPPYVAQVFDRYLATIDRRCACGKCLYYVRHLVNDDGRCTATVLARCNNGHEEFIELAAAGLRTILPDDGKE